ncbi:putative fad dependent oxidoreductase protein [Cladophialophora carrionii]|uniref:Putative fad dependent oxidoreductase protein n=1 Tax=Cladophialophora carrionii TaxID=86049 RepID=A0A1C1CVS5_9EURO|nr:putative fad dependent oxidoreductase protein [Cladophialophora carrionii]
MGDASTSAAVLAPRTDPPPVQAGLPSVHPTASFWQTSHPNPLTHHRSTPDLPVRADVVVIGSGISGTFAVDQLLGELESSTDLGPARVDVLVLEARTLCSAATGRNGGHLQPVVHAAPASILEFEMKNFDHVSNIVQSSRIPCDFRRLSGCLGFWNETYFEEAKRDLTRTGAKHAELVRVVEDPEQLRKLGLQGGVKGAIVQSVAASLSPYKLCVSIWQKMLSRFETTQHQRSVDGETKRVAQAVKVTLNLQTTTPVTSVDAANNVVDHDGHNRWKLDTPRGSVHARSVILATNGYTSHLLPEFAPLIRPVQAQMSALIPPPVSAPDRDRARKRRLIPMSYGFEGVGTMDRVMSDYLVQNPFVFRTASAQQTNTASNASEVEEGGHLMFGGGRHLAFNHGEQCWDDDSVDENVEKYLRTLPERLNLVADSDANTDMDTEPQADHHHDENDDRTSQPPSLDIAASWTGIIGHSADGRPWVGPIPDRPGIFLCGGYTGHGMTNAPLCGRYIARVALGDLRPQHAGEATGPAPGNMDSESQLELDVDMRVPMEYLISRERMETLSRRD